MNFVPRPKLWILIILLIAITRINTPSSTMKMKFETTANLEASSIECNSDDLEFSYRVIGEGKCELVSDTRESLSAVKIKEKVLKETPILCVPNSLHGRQLVKIGKYSFFNLNYSQILLPDAIEEIESYAFKDCMKLETIRIPPNVTKIMSHTFENCYSLQSINISNILTKVSKNAFIGCSNKVKIFNNKNMIQNNNDGKISKMSSIITDFTDNILTIKGNGVLESNLVKEFPDKYDDISMTIDGPTEIFYNAIDGKRKSTDSYISFYQNLEYIEIGSSVVTIRSDAISNIPSLKQIKFTGVNVERTFGAQSLFVGANNLKIYYCSSITPQMDKNIAWNQYVIDKYSEIHVPTNYEEYNSQYSFLKVTTNLNDVNCYTDNS